MKLASAYAVVTFFVCLLSFVGDSIGISRGGVLSEKVDYLTVMGGLELFWIFASVAATGYFLSIKAPIKAPLVYSTYYGIGLVLATILIITEVTKKNPQVMLTWDFIDILITAWIAKLNFDLLKYVKADRIRMQKEEEDATS